MEDWQSSLSQASVALGGGQVAAPKSRPAIDYALIGGLAGMALGFALFAIGIYHGFENGSCSTTGYSAHYGPIQHCAKGIGWWMLLVMCGLVIGGIGAVASGIGGALGAPILFVAIGAPFIALAFRSGSSHLLQNASSSTGKIFSGVFGVAFVIGGLVWGAFTAGGALPRMRSQVAGTVVSTAVGIGIAFVIATGVSSAIGTTKASATSVTFGQSGAAPLSGTALQAAQAQEAQIQAQMAQKQAAARQATAAAAKQASNAVKQAVSRAGLPAGNTGKLAACVVAANGDISKLQACQTQYAP
jgi:hypothetical protein